ncbi:MAG: hypothetical protein ACRDID_12630 [Ktedonobacterales bacterium]
MPCLIALLMVTAPRLAFLFMWVFTPLVDRAFNTFVGPLLGLAFLPLTSIMYVVLWTPGVGVVGWEWLWIVLAFVLDLTSYAGSVFGNRQQIEGYPGSTGSV